MNSGSFDRDDFEKLARVVGEQAKAFKEAARKAAHDAAHEAGAPGFGPQGPGEGRGRGRGPRGFGGPRGRGPRGGFRTSDVPSADDAAGWFAGRLPDGWFTGPVEVNVDRDEIIVVGPIDVAEQPKDATPAQTAAAESGRIARFREDTREERIGIALQAEHRYQRKVAWGAQAGGTRELFSVANVPVMTRLLQSERQVLDTLVDGGVARSRSEALAWCVRLVGDNAGTWLKDLRDALGAVDEVRKAGPSVGTPVADDSGDDSGDDSDTDE